MPNYSNARIYQIVNSANNNVYIGSTTQKLGARMTEHRYNAKRYTTPLYCAMNKIGIDKFRIILVKSISCANKEELVAAEYEVMKEFAKNGCSLYNSTTDGSCSETTKSKMSAKMKGRKLTPEHIAKAKAVRAATDRRGANSHMFKGGSIFKRENHGSVCWGFCYRSIIGEEKKYIAKTFSVNKYGERGALFLARSERYLKYGGELPKI